MIGESAFFWLPPTSLYCVIEIPLLRVRVGAALQVMSSRSGQGNCCA